MLSRSQPGTLPLMAASYRTLARHACAIPPDDGPEPQAVCAALRVNVGNG